MNFTTKIGCWGFALLASALCAAPGVGEVGEAIPETLYAQNERLQFVALERSVDPSGRVDRDLLGPGTAASLEAKLAQEDKVDGCIRISGQSSLDGTYAGLENLQASLHTSDNVLLGRVVGRRVGSIGSRFGTLLLVESEDVLVGAPSFRFHIFFPKGEFQFQGKDYCVVNAKYPEVPEVEDRVLVMHQDQFHGSQIIGLGPNQLIVLPEGGSPRFGSQAAGHHDLSFEVAQDVVTWVQDSLGLAKTR